MTKEHEKYLRSCIQTQVTDTVTGFQVEAVLFFRQKQRCIVSKTYDASIEIPRKNTIEAVKDRIIADVKGPADGFETLLFELFEAHHAYGCGFYDNDRWKDAYKKLQDMIGYRKLKWDYFED